MDSVPVSQLEVEITARLLVHNLRDVTRKLEEKIAEEDQNQGRRKDD